MPHPITKLSEIHFAADLVDLIQGGLPFDLPFHQLVPLTPENWEAWFASVSEEIQAQLDELYAQGTLLEDYEWYEVEPAAAGHLRTHPLTPLEEAELDQHEEIATRVQGEALFGEE